MSAPPFSADDYIAVLQSMLPRGKVWPRDADAPLTLALQGLAQSFAEATARANNLLTVAFPATVDDMLPEWNETLGLPGLTGYTGSDLATQQAQVVAAFTDAGGQSPAYFIGLAATLGIPITINGYRPYRVNDHVNDPITGQPWAHVWRVNVPAGYDYTVLETLFNLYKPAHTTVLFAAATPPPPPPPPVPPSTLLLHFDSETIVDSSANNLTFITQGTAAYSTTTAKFGTGSLNIPTADSYVVGTDPKLFIGTEDFTIDCWINPTGTAGLQFILAANNSGSQYSGIVIFLYGGGNLLYWNDGDNSYGGTTSVPSGSWHHVEVGRASGTVYLFLDGELLTTTPGIDGSFLGSTWVIGAAQYYPPGVDPLIGWIDEFHAVIGTCLHTESFTPPTAPYTS